MPNDLLTVAEQPLPHTPPVVTFWVGQRPCSAPFLPGHVDLFGGKIFADVMKTSSSCAHGPCCPSFSHYNKIPEIRKL